MWFPWIPPTPLFPLEKLGNSLQIRCNTMGSRSLLTEKKTKIPQLFQPHQTSLSVPLYRTQAFSIYSVAAQLLGVQAARWHTEHQLCSWAVKPLVRRKGPFPQSILSASPPRQGCATVGSSAQKAEAASTRKAGCHFPMPGGLFRETSHSGAEFQDLP